MRLGRELLESREVVKLVEFKLARDTPKGRQSDRVGAGFDRTQRGDGRGGEAYPAVDRARHHPCRDVETETMKDVPGDEERSGVTPARTSRPRPRTRPRIASAQ